MGSDELASWLHQADPGRTGGGLLWPRRRRRKIEYLERDDPKSRCPGQVGSLEPIGPVTPARWPSTGVVPPRLGGHGQQWLGIGILCGSYHPVPSRHPQLHHPGRGWSPLRSASRRPMAVWREQLGLAFFGAYERGSPHFRLTGSDRGSRSGHPQQHVQRQSTDAPPTNRRHRVGGGQGGAGAGAGGVPLAMRW